MNWTKDEIQLLRTLSLEELYEQFPHRSRSAIQIKRSRVTAQKLKRWTREERLILERHYSSEGREILARLPNRSWEAVKSQVLYLRKRGWNIPR
jgi:hypothetical protein